MLAVEVRAVVIFTLMAYCVAFNNCNKSKAWIENICPPRSTSLKCLYRDGQEIQLHGGHKVKLFCNNNAPYNQTIECANILKINSLEMFQCHLSNFKMQEFLEGKSPRYISIVGNGRNIFSLDAEFYNLPRLKTLLLLNVRTGGRFTLAFEALNLLEDIEITNHDFAQFSPKPFKDLQSLRQFTLQNGTINVFPQDLLDNLTKLNNLNLRLNKITDIRLGAFKHLKRLKTLDLSHNRIQILQAQLFHSLSSLVVLIISNNNLTTLPLGLFSFTTGLHLLDAEENRNIGIVPNDFFVGAIRLQYFSCSSCGLTEIDQKLFLQPKVVQRRSKISYFQKLLRKAKVFIGEYDKCTSVKHARTLNATPLNPFIPDQIHLRSNFKSLESLNISHNKISDIKDKTFEPLTGLKILDASFNPLKVLPKEMPFGSSNILTEIFLTNCQLSAIPEVIFSKHKLKQIDLSYNQIFNVILPVYSSSQIQSVKLSHNQIQNIKLNFSITGNHSPSYYILGNPLVCDCELEEFLQFVHRLNKTSISIFPDANKVKCNFLNKTLILTDVWIKDVDCKIKNCPKSCECNKTRRNEIEANCSIRGLVSAPNILPYGTKVLFLQNNYISTLINQDHESWNTLTKLFLSNNSLTSLNKWTKISQNLITLAIDNNELSDLPLSVRNIVNSTTEFRIFLSGNKWVCECRTYSLIGWMKRNKKNIVDYERTNCETTDQNNTVLTVPIDQVDEERFCDDNSTSIDVDINIDLATLLSATIFAAILLLLLFFSYLKRYSILALLYDRNIYKLKRTETDLQFDSFILYNATDRRKARKIVNRAKWEYKFCVFGRTKLPDEAKGSELVYEMKNSRTTTLLVSEKFARSTFFQTHFRKAYQELHASHRRRFILIFVGKFDIKFLPRDLRYLLSGDRRIQWNKRLFWEKLRFFLAPPSKEIRRKSKKQKRPSLRKKTEKKSRRKQKKKPSS